jgi:hypothetical protein
MNLTVENVAELCAHVRVADERPLIDLSDVSFFEPFALIYLGMFLRHFNARGKSFRVRPPVSSAAKGYLARQNFWQRFNFDPATIKQSVLRRFDSSTSLNDIVDVERRLGIEEEIAHRVREIVAHSRARLDLELLEETVAELVDNFRRHSRGPLAALATQWYPRIGELNIAVGDCGVGIRTSLSSNARYASLRKLPHYDAIRKAVQPGVSRTHEAGFGLSTVLDNVESTRGRIFLASGNGYVRKYGKSVARYGTMPFDLSGVQINIVIPTR